jgi:hypothetical protein
MLNRWRAHIEVIANVSIIVVACLACILLVQRITRRSDGRTSPQPVGSPRTGLARSGPSIGEHLQLAGVDWSTSARTVVLVLSAKCHFCSDSAPFYRRLADAAAVRGVRILAVMPEPRTEAAPFLASIGISDRALVTASPSAVHAPGTPTLILVSRSGSVDAVWLGRLRPEAEADVVTRLTEQSPAVRGQ